MSFKNLTKISRREEEYNPIERTIGCARAKHAIQIGINRNGGNNNGPGFLANDRMFINVSAVNQRAAFGNICGSTRPPPVSLSLSFLSSRLSAIISPTNGNNNINGRRCNGIADVNFDADNRKTVPRVIATIISLNHLLYCTFDALDTTRGNFTANFHH